MWSWAGDEGVESPRTVVWGRKREAMMILLLRRELIAADDEGRAVGGVVGGEGEYLCSDQFSSMTSGATCVPAMDSAPGAGAAAGISSRFGEERASDGWIYAHDDPSQSPRELDVDVLRTYDRKSPEHQLASTFVRSPAKMPSNLTPGFPRASLSVTRPASSSDLAVVPVSPLCIGWTSLRSGGGGREGLVICLTASAPTRPARALDRSGKPPCATLTINITFCVALSLSISLSVTRLNGCGIGFPIR